MRRVIVFHRSFGCDTGCCGHAIIVTDKPYEQEEQYDLDEVPSSFDFHHPWGTDEEVKAWAEHFVRQELGEDHIADLDWAHCLIVKGDDE